MYKRQAVYKKKYRYFSLNCSVLFGIIFTTDLLVNLVMFTLINRVKIETPYSVQNGSPNNDLQVKTALDITLNYYS